MLTKLQTPIHSIYAHETSYTLSLWSYEVFLEIKHQLPTHTHTHTRI